MRASALFGIWGVSTFRSRFLQFGFEIRLRGSVVPIVRNSSGVRLKGSEHLSDTAPLSSTSGPTETFAAERVGATRA